MANITWKHWTPAEEEYLRQNYQTKRQREIAEELNRTVIAVSTRAIKLGLKSRELWTADETAFLLANKDKGHAWCAEQLNRSLGAVQHYARRIDIRLTRPRITPEEKQQIRQWHAQGLTNIEIAERLTCHMETVRRALRRLQIPTKRNKSVIIPARQLFQVKEIEPMTHAGRPRFTPVLQGERPEPKPHRKPKNVFEAVVFGVEDFFPLKDPEEPTAAMPGSLEKLAVLAQRAERGEDLWSAKDRHCKPVEADVVEALAEAASGGRAGFSRDTDDEEPDESPETTERRRRGKRRFTF